MILKLRNNRIITVATPITSLTVQSDSADTTSDVLSDDRFSGSNKYLLFGQFGSENSEIVAFTSSTGNVLTHAALIKDHPNGTPVYLLEANQVQFERSTTSGGTYTELGKVNIDAESEFTVYDDTTNTTGFGRARFYNSGATAAYGTYYEIIKYDEDDRKTRGFVKQVSLDNMNAVLDGSEITEAFLDNNVRLCDETIRQARIRWTQESLRLFQDTEIGVSWYDLSSYLKDTDTIESLQFVSVKNERIEIVKRDVFDRFLDSAVRTTLAVAITATTETEITLTDTSDFADEGTILIQGDSISYTANDRSTNILSGVTDISETHAVTTTGGNDMEVWQNAKTGIPNVATIVDGILQVYPVFNSEEDTKQIKLDVVKKYTQITLDSDVLAFPPQLYTKFLEGAIAQKRGDRDYLTLQDKFQTELLKFKMRNGSVVERRIRPRVSLYNQSKRGYLNNRGATY